MRFKKSLVLMRNNLRNNGIKYLLIKVVNIFLLFFVVPIKLLYYITNRIGPFSKSKNTENKVYSINSINKSNGELIVFVIGEWALTHKKIDTIEKLFRKKEKDFDIIDIIKLNPEQKGILSQKNIQQKSISNSLLVTGGVPASLIIAFDYHPASLKPKFQKKYPAVSNCHIFYKDDIIKIINDVLLITMRKNFMHACNNEIEAWQLLDSIMTQEYVNNLKNNIDKRRKLYNTEFEVVKLIHSVRTRGKIELVKYNGKLAIKKTFKKGRERFFENEKLAYSTLSKTIPYIPQILESGQNYIIIPYINNILKGKTNKQKQILLEGFKTELRDFISLMHSHGYALIDMWYGNTIITPENKLKIIDFEFLYKYHKIPENVESAYEIAGVPKGIEIDLPKNHRYGTNFKTKWKFSL